MAYEDELYSEPIKTAVRKRVLEHAINALTANRESSALVSEDYFIKTIDYAADLITKYSGSNFQGEMPQVKEAWLTLQQSRVSKRDTVDIHVLILCGPNPLNDFHKLMELGVPPANIWAVESDRKCFNKALARLKEEGLPVRLYCGSLQEFFAIVPQQFDLVYFDACGPLIGGKPATLPVLRELFLNQRLSQLSVLITNFCGTQTDSSNSNEWTKRLASWYAPRYEEPVYSEIDVEFRVLSYETSKDEENDYHRHIQENLKEYYSDFITKFITEFSGQLLPWWRVMALKGLAKDLFAETEIRNKAITAAFSTPDKFNPNNPFAGFGHANLHPAGYPHLWTSELAKRILPTSDTFRHFVLDEGFHQAKLMDAIQLISLVRNFFESNAEWGKHNREACSSEFANILENFTWFDSPGMQLEGLFCDTPLPNLIADLCIGQSGYPYHANIEKSLRLSYQAKTNQMFTDVFVFDQARYLYDLIPSVHLFGDQLPPSIQILSRVCMDGIRRHAHYGCPDLFRGCALAGIGENGYSVHIPPDRETVQ
jgi:hypothetical protein